MSVCTFCGNTGWVVVPHPQFVDDGFWKPHHKNSRGRPVFYTAGVTCTCSRGRKIKEIATEAKDRQVKPMSLEEYRAKVFHDPQMLLDEIYPPAKPANLGTFKPKEEVKRVAKQFAEVPD